MYSLFHTYNLTNEEAVWISVKSATLHKALELIRNALHCVRLHSSYNIVMYFIVLSHNVYCIVRQY